jgi:toxin YoeB
MRIILATRAWEDYLHWQNSDAKLVKRIHELIKDSARIPFSGIGKPEPLRFVYAGYWSRRITDEHRMVYKVEDGNLLLVQLRYHY